MRFSKKIVLLVILSNMVFTSAAFYVFFKVGNEPTALIAAWFTFTTTELWSLAGIRKKKEEGRKDDERDKLETKIDE